MIHDFLSVWMELWVLPARWGRRLRDVSVPVLLDEMQAELAGAGPLSLSPRTIARLVRRRVMWTIRWRRTRCLLSGMLVSYLLARAGHEVTVYIGCDVPENAALMSHCWVSCAALPADDPMQSPQGMEPMYTKTFGAGITEGSSGTGAED